MTITVIIRTMPLPENAYLQFAPDLRICRVLNGLWQVSGAHGRIDPQRAVPAMLAYHDAGFTTWDLADHYGPAEDFIDQFKTRLIAERGADAWRGVQAFTKWVPRPGRMTRKIVEDAVDVSLRRMQVDALDLLQFHWWEYGDAAYLDALGHLSHLRDAGKIKHLALTNFDTAHLEIIVNAGITIVSNQVQFSLVDRRPERKMAPFCAQHGIALLTYGTLCGGLLSEKFIGQPEPQRWSLPTASAQKYKNMIDAWGGWALFQQLLAALKRIADKHNASIANIAVRAVLDQPAVAGVIAGARLGISEHMADNARVFALALDDEDRAQIDAVSQQSRDLMRIIGDCGDEYRG
jgi:aryl-alcohol dehydrogenase-like predicted oxidoreductase